MNVGAGIRRVVLAWRELAPDQRLAAGAAIALFFTMFLPWYSKSAVGVRRGLPVKVQDSLSAFQAFSFVEAAVLLVAAGVLYLVFARGEGKAFHLPGGDGTVILAAGVWATLASRRPSASSGASSSRSWRGWRSRRPGSGSGRRTTRSRRFPATSSRPSSCAIATPTTSRRCAART